MKPLLLREAPEKLRDGALLVAPFEESLMLICDARSKEAIATLRELKNRPPEKGFTILVDSDARLNRYVKDVPAIAWDIIDTSEDAVILVLPDGQKTAEHALASDGSIAIRMVNTTDEQALVQAANAPIACTALLDENGLPATYLEAGDPLVLAKVDYVLTLPTAKTTYPGRKIPIIGLEMDGSIRIIRE